MTLDLTEEEWKKRLTPEQYHILRKAGTETPFTGKLLDNKEGGDYTCAACGWVLFNSDTKFDSGTGWPSFYEVAKSDAVELRGDDTLGKHRVEAVCANCGSHLGHVFEDAPSQPTGKRFCINSISLDFKKKDERAAKTGK